MSVPRRARVGREGVEKKARCEGLRGVGQGQCQRGQRASNARREAARQGGYDDCAQQLCPGHVPASADVLLVVAGKKAAAAAAARRETRVSGSQAINLCLQLVRHSYG